MCHPILSYRWHKYTEKPHRCISLCWKCLLFFFCLLLWCLNSPSNPNYWYVVKWSCWEKTSSLHHILKAFKQWQYSIDDITCYRLVSPKNNNPLFCSNSSYNKATKVCIFVRSFFNRSVTSQMWFVTPKSKDLALIRVFFLVGLHVCLCVNQVGPH